MAAKAKDYNTIVGMWALILNEDQTIFRRVFIYGMVQPGLYIVQGISALTGESNIAKLVPVERMGNWIFLPDKEIAEWVDSDASKNGGKVTMTLPI